jgi:hypothetical protein
MLHRNLIWATNCRNVRKDYHEDKFLSLLLSYLRLIFEIIKHEIKRGNPNSEKESDCRS